MPATLYLQTPKRTLAHRAWLWATAAFVAVCASGAAESVSPSAEAPQAGLATLSETNQPAQKPWEDPAGLKPAPEPTLSAKQEEELQTLLKLARHHRLARDFKQAIAEYASLVEGEAPDGLKRTALLELAQMAQEQNELPRAQQIYAQWLERWPRDAGVPEVTLRQGLVLRQMGLHNRAITKFYAVMTSALVLKPERFEYYQQLVLRAQNEIAETQYELGNYAEAGDSFGRLLRLEYPPVNRAGIQHRYIQCLGAAGRQAEAITQAQDFLNRYPDAPERPEVHFLCATTLKRAGRNSEAFQQVLALLQEQHAATNVNPAILSYWQRRAGNELANQFYQEGEPMKALDVYLRLADLDPAPDWQLPVWYQIGLVFERLNQPAKAIEFYGKIGAREKEVGQTGAASLKAVLEMAKWRSDFLGWQQRAELVNLRLQSALHNATQTNTPAISAPASVL